MERAAHLERDAPAGTGLLCKLCSLVHCGLFAANDQLARAIVVADLHTAQRGCLLTAFCKGDPVEVQHCGHAAVDAAGRVGHGFAAIGCQLNGLLGGEYTGGFQRGIFAQRETGHISGLDPLLGQNGGYAAGKGHHAGLGVFGLIQNAVRVVEADAVQIKRKVCSVERGTESGRCFVKFFAHAGVLGTLAGIQNCKLHRFCLHSVTSSSISSRTVYIRSSLPTLAPQKKSPSSRLPLTASISAWVMQ